VSDVYRRRCLINWTATTKFVSGKQHTTLCNCWTVSGTDVNFSFWHTDHRSQITDHRSQITDHRSQITDHWSWITDHGSQIMDHRSQITDHWSRITDHWSLITDHWSLITDHGSQIMDHRSWITDHRSQSRNEYLIFTLLLLLLMTFIGRKLRHAANAPSQPLHNNSYPRTGTFSESTIP